MDSNRAFRGRYVAVSSMDGRAPKRQIPLLLLCMTCGAARPAAPLNFLRTPWNPHACWSGFHTPGTLHCDSSRTLRSGAFRPSIPGLSARPPPILFCPFPPLPPLFAKASSALTCMQLHTEMTVTLGPAWRRHAGPFTAGSAQSCPHVRRPRHHRASTRRLAGARPDAVHRGWIHPLHDRAVDVFRPLLTPVHWGVFRHCRHPMGMRPYPAVPARSVHTPQALGSWQFLATHTPASPQKTRTECLLFTFRDLALFFLVPALFP